MSHALIFSRTTGYRHESIEHGAAVIAALLATEGCTSEHSEDAGAFTPDRLATYDLVVWLSVIGDVLDGAQRSALASWLHDGGAWAGVHGASAAEEGWAEYPRIVGARFTGHPEIQTAPVRVADTTHPSTAGLPSTWVHTDEWYDFASHPGPDRTVLLTVDEADYDGATMGAGAAHPLAWHGPYGRGRTWYTSLGHTVESYDDPLLREHLRGGLAGLLG